MVDAGHADVGIGACNARASASCRRRLLRSGRTLELLLAKGDGGGAKMAKLGKAYRSFAIDTVLLCVGTVMLEGPQRRLWRSCPHTNHLVVLRAQWSAAPPLVAQKAAAAEPSIRHRRWRLRAPSAHLGAAGAGRRQQALEAPNQPSRCFTGPVYRAASAPVRAHGCGEAAAHQPPRRRGSAVRGGSCRSARAAARPAAGLSRDSRFGG